MFALFTGPVDDDVHIWLFRRDGIKARLVLLMYIHNKYSSFSRTQMADESVPFDNVVA